jgi:hypothetical protein
MMTLRRAACLTLLCAATVASPAGASSYLDLSQPMTGKSRSVVHADGTPVEMGVAAKPANVASRDEPAEQGAVGPGGTMTMDHGITGDMPRNAAGSRPDCGPYFGMRRCGSRNTVININERRDRTARSSPSPSKPFRIRIRRR